MSAILLTLFVSLFPAADTPSALEVAKKLDALCRA